MDSMDEGEPEPPPPTSTPSLPPLSNLILSLEQAALMAKQLPSTADPTHLLHIHSSLHQAHHHLSSFLSTTHFPPAAENSLSSAAGNDPMDLAGEEENSKVTIEKVEEQMRGCFIKNKRGRKRRISPSAAAVTEERRVSGDGVGVGVGGSVVGFDPYGTKVRALELVYQFHL